MPIISGKKVTPFPGLHVKSRDSLRDSVVLFDNVSVAPVSATGKYFLYVEGGVLKFDNGSSSTSLTGGVAGTIPSWETIFGDDSNMALTTAAWTVSQAGNFGNIILTKSGTGAGVPLVINNAGTGYDLSITNTNAEAAGIEIYSKSDWGNGTSSDVVLTWAVAGNSSNGTEREFGNIKLTATDATDGSEDGTWSLDAMVAGTSRTVFSLAGTTLKAGYAGGIFSSNGNYDVVLQTGNATTGTITITDGSAGAIALAPDTTGVVTISTGLQVGGTTPTASIFNVAGSGGVGTTGYGFKVNATTLTTGTALLVDSASSSSGLLLDLQLASSSVFSVSETGALIIAGVSAATSAITLTVGKLTLSDGNVAITSSSTTDVVSITDDSLLANNALIVKGSGAFTGTGASSFVAITPTGTTTGTALYVAMAGATTAAIGIDVTTSTTTGKAMVLTNTGILTGVGAALSIVADAATTAGASAGEGVVNISVDGLTTGAALNIESLSNELLTSGVLAHFDHSAVGTTIAAKTGALVSVTSSITESGTSTQDFDMVSVVRTSVHNTAGTLTATGSLMYLENVATETNATLTDTVNGLEVVMDAQGTGTGIKVTHPATTGKSLDIIASTTTGTVALLTMNSLTTTGVGLSLTNTGTGMTSGSVLRVASGTTDAVATNGIVSLFATGAFTSTAVTDGFVRVNGNSTLTGTIVAVNGNSFTSGIGLYVGDTGTGMTSGSLVRAVSASTGAVATNGILSVQATGAYTSTAHMGILAAIANTTTAGTVAYISATSMIGGTLLFLNATAATLTGKYIECYDGAANDFSVGQYGATIIAGNEGSTVFTVTAGDLLVSQGSLALTDNDNAASVSITNDTATTIGAAANGGVIDVSGDGLTTGTLLNLSITDGTLAGGRYVKGWDVTRGAEDWAIIEDGVAYLAEGIGTTAGGAHVMSFGTSQVIDIAFGSGAPTVAASQGSLYLRTDGSSTSTRLYINTDGASTWTAVTTAA